MSYWPRPGFRGSGLERFGCSGLQALDLGFGIEFELVAATDPGSEERVDCQAGRQSSQWSAQPLLGLCRSGPAAFRTAALSTL